MSDASHQLTEHLRAYPGHNLELITTSVEGVAIAATCAAADSVRSITWRLVHLAGEHVSADDVLVVEPVDAGAGWQSAVRSRFPRARFFFPKPTTSRV